MMKKEPVMKNVDLGTGNMKSITPPLIVGGKRNSTYFHNGKWKSSEYLSGFGPKKVKGLDLFLKGSKNGHLHMIVTDIGNHSSQKISPFTGIGIRYCVWCIYDTRKASRS